MKKVLLFVFLLGMSLCEQSHKLSPQYTISLQYACRQKTLVQSCQGQVWWNGQLVFDLQPIDYQIKTASAKVAARKGENVLQIRGKGVADGHGLTIDDVSLIKDGTDKNLVANSGFELPNQNGHWNIYDNVEGWTGKQFEIGRGKIYNKRWNSQVCELDANFMNAVMWQSFYLENKVEYVLSFDWAPRTNGNENLATSKGAVLIGNQKVADLQADCKNSGVRHTQLIVSLDIGSYGLSFAGLGQNDSYGVTVSNVILRRKDGKENILVNGDFSSPSIGNSWQLFRGGVKGWQADVAEVGYCKIYNNSWQGGQCIELDSSSNQVYTQKFTVV